MIETLITKVGIPELIEVLSESLGRIDNPVMKTASEALSKVDEAMKGGAIPQEQLIEINRHAEAMAAMQVKEFENAIGEVNQSLRAEVSSNDAYVRRMRPTFGYLMAATWAAQMFGIAYVIIFKTEQAGAIMAAMSSLSAIWAVGLSVLGIYVYKRSEEKRSAGGNEPIFWLPSQLSKKP